MPDCPCCGAACNGFRARALRSAHAMRRYGRGTTERCSRRLYLGSGEAQHGCEPYKQNALYSESTEWSFSADSSEALGSTAQMHAGFAGKTRHTAIQHGRLFRLAHVKHWKTALTSLTGAYEAVNGANTSASRAKHGVCWANATKSIRLTHAKGVRTATRTAQSLIPKRLHGLLTRHARQSNPPSKNGFAESYIYKSSPRADDSRAASPYYRVTEPR